MAEGRYVSKPALKINTLWITKDKKTKKKNKEEKVPREEQLSSRDMNIIIKYIQSVCHSNYNL
jgi:hypothetical protein